MADWVFNATGTGRAGTIQEWVVPATGEYRITAYGAQGGGAEGGLGARMAGTFELTEGQVVRIAVGQSGLQNGYAYSGGGGTFVVAQDDSPLLVAGGGGGSPGEYSDRRHATISSDGQDGAGATEWALGGTSGGGGGGVRRGAGGAGWMADGQNGTQMGSGGGAYGGLRFENGALGGDCYGDAEVGGFGGGGAAWYSGWSGAGGGGGYSGGGAGRDDSTPSTSLCGGGGGSYNTGTDQDNQGAFQAGHGLVEIEALLPELEATPTWDHATDTYTLNVEWYEIDGATDYRLRLLDADQTLLEEITTTGLAYTFTGLAAETTYHLELTWLDGSTELETLTREVATPIGLPGGVSGLQHTFTTDSLAFTWDAAKDADEYLLTLSLDGAEVATQTVTDLTATFDTLEDGTQYDLAIQAENAQGGGPIAYYQAATQYLPPAMPINLRQFEERIIAVICQWDVPTKVLQVRVQLVYGDLILYDEFLPYTQLERTFPVPMASTHYLLRVRTGNPAGWSDWVEAWVHSEDFPRVDSRIAVLAGTYQEDELYGDTWDGGANLGVFGVTETLKADPAFEIIEHVTWPTYRLPYYQTPLDEGHYNANFSISASEEDLSLRYSQFDECHYDASFTVSASEVDVSIKKSAFDECHYDSAFTIAGIEARKQYMTSVNEHGHYDSYFEITAFEDKP